MVFENESMTDVTAEVHFAQKLAANEKKIRDRAIKKLRRWFEVRSQRTKGSNIMESEEIRNP